MYAFWDTIIEPLLEITEPRSLLEVGAHRGAATEKMLGYCERHGAVLHSVDPVPQFDVTGLLERHDGRFVFHERLSLDAIPEVPPPDAAFLDGDHNWHTVYNELRSIRESCEAASRPFPLVFMHDVDWPYGRRDLYYDPQNIPEQYRHPHGGGGMVPGVPGLVPDGGLNARSPNARLEGGARNGVLTAVEDFLATAPGVEMVRLRGLFGLAILFPPGLREERPDFGAFLEALEVSPIMARHLERAEEERVRSEIAKQDRARRAAKVRARAKGLAEENRALRARIGELDRGRGGRPSAGAGRGAARLDGPGGHFLHVGLAEGASTEGTSVIAGNAAALSRLRRQLGLAVEAEGRPTGAVYLDTDGQHHEVLVRRANGPDEIEDMMADGTA